MASSVRLERLVPLILEQASSCPDSAKLWVLLPSMQLVRELEGLLLAEGRAFVNVWLMTAKTAAEKILQDRGITIGPRVATRTMLAVTKGLIAELLVDAGADSRGELQYLLDYPDNARGLLRVLLELRKEGLTGHEPIAMTSQSGRSSWKILARLHQRLEEKDCCDEARQIDMAVTAFEQPASGDPHKVLLFSTFPRTQGSQRRLAACLGKRAETLALGPLSRDPSMGSTLSVIQDRARLLFNRDVAPPTALGAEHVRIFSAQGDEEELREALQRARALIISGAQPERIAIVLSDVSAYAPYLATLSGSEGVPVDSAIGTSLLGEALAMLAVDLIHLLADNFDRRLLMRCLADPLLARSCFFKEAFAKDMFTVQGLGEIDERTRAAGCIAGKDELLRALGAEHPLNGVLTKLEACRKALQDTKSAREQAERLCAFMEDLIHAEDVRHLEILDEIKRSCRTVGERSLFDLPAMSLPELARELRTALAEEVSKHQAFRDGGVQCLSIERMRGLSFDHVFLLGFNRDRFPKRGGSDAWFNEKERCAMRSFLEAHGAGAGRGEGLLPPIRLAREVDLIQREDLRAVLHGARKTVCISFQRADSSGREKAPSLWLRHLSRALLGTENVKSVVNPENEYFTHVPFEPQTRIRARLDKDRPLSEVEALTLAALSSHSKTASHSKTLSRLAGRVAPSLARALDKGIAMITKKESFAAEGARQLVYDAMHLGSVLASAVPVTQFEVLGNCPLQFFFSQVLGVRSLSDEPELFAVSRLHVGSSLHKLMEDVIRQMIEGGFFAFDADCKTATLEARRLVNEALDRRLRQLTSRLEQSHAILLEEATLRWKNGLCSIIELDINDAWDNGWRPQLVEEKVERELELGGGSSTRHKVRIKGRMDRIDRKEDGAERIIDYKSGGQFKTSKLHTEFYKGKRLQLPLYTLMTSWDEKRSHAELRGLSPEHLLQSEGVLPKTEVHAKLWENVEGLQESLGVLAELLEAGNFPFRAERHCSYCPYRAACPRHHRPSQDRQDSLSDLRLWHLLPLKGANNPLFADAQQAPQEETE